MKDDSTPCLALRLNEAAAAIGVSARTLWQWVTDGIGPPCVRIWRGKKATLLFPSDALREWLEKRVQQQGRRSHEVEGVSENRTESSASRPGGRSDA
jgi:predicted DNA-binding transcriptional regulator AlpA